MVIQIRFHFKIGTCSAQSNEMTNGTKQSSLVCYKRSKVDVNTLGRHARDKDERAFHSSYKLKNTKIINAETTVPNALRRPAL